MNISSILKKVSGAALNLPNMLEAKQNSVNGVANGVEFLFKQNKVNYIQRNHLLPLQYPLPINPINQSDSPTEIEAPPMSSSLVHSANSPRCQNGKGIVSALLSSSQCRPAPPRRPIQQVSTYNCIAINNAHTSPPSLSPCTTLSELT